MRTPPGGFDQVSALICGDEYKFGRPTSSHTAKRLYAAELKQQIEQRQNDTDRVRFEGGFATSQLQPRRVEVKDMHLSRPDVYSGDLLSGAEGEQAISRQVQERQPFGNSLQHVQADAQQVSPPGAFNRPLPTSGHVNYGAGHVMCSTTEQCSPPQQMRLPPEYPSYQNHFSPGYSAQLHHQMFNPYLHRPYENYQGSTQPLHHAVSGGGIPWSPVANGTAAYDGAVHPSAAHGLQHSAAGHSMHTQPAPQSQTFQRVPPAWPDTAAASASRTQLEPAGLLSFMHRPDYADTAGQKATYRAELQAQIQEAHASKSRRKQEDLAADQRMLDGLQRSPPQSECHVNRARTVQFANNQTHSGGASEQPDARSKDYGFMHTAPGSIHGQWGQPENSSANFNAHDQLRRAQTCTTSQKGRANMESVLGDTPLLRFKSDKTFLTAGELEQRAAAAHQLKDALSAQIEEKKQRKAAEKAAERQEELAELVRIEREQKQLAQRQMEEARKERSKNELSSSQEQVMEAWRKAQDEAEASRGSRFVHAHQAGDANSQSSMQHMSERPARNEPLAVERRLTPEVEGRVAPLRTEMTSQFEQVRREVAAENSRLQQALQDQHAEMKNLMERASRFEQQSFAAQQELEAMRVQMHAQDVRRAELDMLNVPQVPDRLNLPSVHMYQASPHAFWSRHDRAQRASPSRNQDYSGQAYIQRDAGHPSQHHGFLPDMPTPARRLRVPFSITPVGTHHSPRRINRQDMAKSCEEPLLAHASFIPVNDPRSFVHTAAPASAASRTAMLHSDSSCALEVTPPSMRVHTRVGHQGKTGRMERAHVARSHDLFPESPEALDEFLTSFVNEGSSASPLYSTSKFLHGKDSGHDQPTLARVLECLDSSVQVDPHADATKDEDIDYVRPLSETASTVERAEAQAAAAADTIASAEAVLETFHMPDAHSSSPIGTTTRHVDEDTVLKSDDVHLLGPQAVNVKASMATTDYSTLRSRDSSQTGSLEL